MTVNLDKLKAANDEAHAAVSALKPTDKRFVAAREKFNKAHLALAEGRRRWRLDEEKAGRRPSAVPSAEASS